MALLLSLAPTEMNRRFLISTVTLSIAVLLLGCLSACDGCEDTPEEEQLPWRFASDQAPYEVTFPPEWIGEPPGSINPHADLAASRDDRFFFMVIPQELPTFPSPDVFELQRVALENLDNSVDNFLVERQGPLVLDGVSGLTVFARGQLEGENIHYITSYAIQDGIGYQIVAFTNEGHSSQLFREVDQVLSTWTFVDVSESETQESAPAASEQTTAPASEPEPPLD